MNSCLLLRKKSWKIEIPSDNDIQNDIAENEKKC